MAPSARGDLPRLDLQDEDDAQREVQPGPRTAVDSTPRRRIAPVNSPATEDAGPGRVIATMVGIVGILLLGSLFWSAVGGLFGALSQVGTILPIDRSTPIPFATATVVPAPAPTVRPALEPTTTAPTPRPTAVPTLAPTAVPTPVPAADEGGRNPWVLLPQPAPGTKVTAGTIKLEARGRGDAKLTGIKLELDGAALPTTFEQTGDTIWRGTASAKVGAGSHSARAVVTDERGRTGAFRWSFDAGP